VEGVRVRGVGGGMVGGEEVDVWRFGGSKRVLGGGVGCGLVEEMLDGFVGTWIF